MILITMPKSKTKIPTDQHEPVVVVVVVVVGVLLLATIVVPAVAIIMILVHELVARVKLPSIAPILRTANLPGWHEEGMVPV